MDTVEEDGQKVRKPIKHPVRHWYWRDNDGNIRFAIRVYNKRLEVEKGKTDILVGKDEDLPKTVQALLAAVNGGEFDSHIKKAVEQRQQRKAN